MSIELKKSFVETFQTGLEPVCIAHLPIDDDSVCDASDICFGVDIDTTGLDSIQIKAYCPKCKDEASFTCKRQEGNCWVLVEE